MRRKGRHEVLRLYFRCQIDRKRGAPSGLASWGLVGGGSGNVGSPPIHMIKYFDGEEEGANAFQCFYDSVRQET